MVLVDPFEEMLARAPQTPDFERLCTGALEFSEEDRRYDKILIKEAIHHIDDKRQLFANLFARLSDRGRMVLVHIPPAIDYPLFTKALERSLSWHADPDELVRLLAQAGFDVEREGFDYRHRLPKETYFQMVEGRYMSLLSSFEDDELKAGLAEMAATYADRDELEFTDHFDFITAVKA